MVDQMRDTSKAVVGAKEAQIKKAFTPREETPEQRARYLHLGGLAGLLGTAIIEKTPASRAQSLAITKLEEALMWAYSAITRNE
jgi:hypothetical protein